VYIREAGYFGLGSLLGDAEIHLTLVPKLGGTKRLVTYTREDPPKEIVDFYPYDRLRTELFQTMDGPARIAAGAKGKWMRFDVDIGWRFWMQSVDGRVDMKASPWTSEGFNNLRTHLRLPGNGTVSVELKDAPPASSGEGRVSLWMMWNIDKILATERKFSIDRRAIAGAIIWEALLNPYKGVANDLATSTGYARFSGPGKVHYKELRPDQVPRDRLLDPAAHEGNTVAREVELLGKLPPRTMEERRKVVATTDGALLYIGTIMRAFSDAAALGGYYLDCDPAMLTNFYNGSWTIAGATTHFQTVKKAPAPLASGTAMGTWMQQKLGVVEKMVARPPDGFCKKPRGY